jgi:hypothetical protein
MSTLTTEILATPPLQHVQTAVSVVGAGILGSQGGAGHRR